MTPAELRQRRAHRRALLRGLKSAIRSYESGDPLLRRMALRCIEIHRESAELAGFKLPATPWERAALEGGA